MKLRYLRQVVLCCAFLFISTPSSDAQIAETWRVVLTNTFEDCHVDAAGNVAVAIPTHPNAELVKISSGGSIAWIASLTNLVINSDISGVLASDISGNFYLSGSSANLATGQVVKVDSEGQSLWRHSMNLGWHRSVLVATDATGNVLGAAVGFIGSPESRFCFVRLTPNGAVQWQTNLAWPSFLPANIRQVRADSSGNWLVLGQSYTTPESRYHLVKLSVDGTMLWARHTGVDWPATAMIEDFAIGGDGTVFVSLDTGFCKLSPAGESVWSITNRGTVLDISADGQVLLNEGRHFTYYGYGSVASLAPNGRTQWRLPLRREALAHARDLDGNHILGTQSFGYWGYPIDFVAVSPDGNQLWATTNLPFGQSSSAPIGLFSATTGEFRLIAEPIQTGARGTAVVALNPQPFAGLPRFTVHPTNQVAATGTNVQMIVMVESPDPVTLQWFHDGGELGGETNSTLTLQDVKLPQSGDYYVQARNAKGAIYSRIGHLRVVIPPYAYVPAQRLSVATGASVDLAVYVSGTEPFTYQWLHNGSALAGETNATLRLHQATLQDAGEYSVWTANEGGFISNLVAVVQVTSAVTQVWRGSQVFSNCCDQACEQSIGPDGSIFVATGGPLLKYESDGSPAWARGQFTLDLVPDGSGGIVYGGNLGLSRVSGDGAELWSVPGAGRVLETWSNRVFSAHAQIGVHDLAGVVLDQLTPNCEDCQWDIRHLRPAPAASTLIAGLVGQSGGDNELAIARIDADGETAWLTRTGIPARWGARDDFDFVVDAAGFATVASLEPLSWPAEKFRLVTLRLDPAGAVLWRSTSDDLSSDGTIRLAVDSTGNVVVAAPTCLIKYTPDGQPLWRTHSGQPRVGVYHPKALTLNSAGDIYLVGGGENYWDRLIAEKLSPDGGSLWATTLSAPFTGQDLADVDLDATGHVVISTAGSLESTTFKLAEPVVPGTPRITAHPESSAQVLSVGSSFVAQCSVAGEAPLHLQWYFQWIWSSEPTPLVGETNLTLVRTNATPYDSGIYFLEASNPFGVATTRSFTVDIGFPPSIWLAAQDTSTLGDFARAIVGSATRFHNFLPDDLPTQWQWSFNGSLLEGATNEFLEIPQVTFANAGVYSLVGTNKYGAGESSIRLYVEDRVHLVSEVREPAGKFVEHSPTPNYGAPRLAVDSSSAVYLLGSFLDEEVGVSRWFVSKYSADNMRQWQVVDDGYGTGSGASAILVDAEDNILVAAIDEAGEQPGQPGGIRLVKLNPSGTQLWQTNYPIITPGTESLSIRIHAFLRNPSNELFLAGISSEWNPASAAYTNFVFVLKLNSQGETLWQKRTSMESFDYWRTVHLAAARDGSAYLGSASGLTHFDGAGNILWHRDFICSGLALDDQQRAYVSTSTGMLVCYGPDGSELWTVPGASSGFYSGPVLMAATNGVFSAGPYQVQRHSSEGNREWTSPPPGGHSLALASNGGVYASMCLAGRTTTRRIAVNGSETWLATSFVGTNLLGRSSAMLVCPNGEIVVAHLFAEWISSGGPPPAFYVLERLREMQTSNLPTLTVTASQTSTRPGDEVCFTSQFTGGPARFQWFRGSYPVPDATNDSYCFKVQSEYDTGYWLQALTADGGFASALTELEIALPYLRPPTLTTNGQWRFGIWPKWTGLDLTLEGSTNLVDWESLATRSPAYFHSFYIDLPPTAASHRFFRIRQPGP